MGRKTVYAMILRRFASSAIERKRISIIGSGPSGFYTAYHLLSKCQVPLDVWLWEALPTPFGLSRYGVAPDHPEVKNCEDTFTAIANRYAGDTQPGEHQFRFIGNVTVGRDLPLKSIIDNFDATILSYGCSGDNRLGIPGEETSSGVFTSREFVNWYNSHPHYAKESRLNDFDWTKVRRVGIIGNGNVSLDITRLLLTSNIDEIWGNTDINQNAIRLLQQAPIEEVRLIARRDFLHSKFTNKELRELWELEKYGIRGYIDPQFFTPSEWDLSGMERSIKRRIEMCEQYLKPFHERKGKSFTKYAPPSEGYSKRWVLDYLKTPLAINTGSNGLITSLSFCENTITKENRVISNNSKELSYEIDLLITSLGYRGQPLPDYSDLGIDFSRNRVACNAGGQVLNKSGNVIPGLFTSGWIRKGGNGVIMTTMMDSFNVGDAVMKYISQLPLKPRTATEVNLTGLNYTTWATWLKIDAIEKDNASNGQPRQKLQTVEEMLKV
ncbi:HEL026Wp [Eremothecium sinecaudum]|uniref:NADPH:adrenodoxin oxidoreductase, mitochondrial n=1 Tax=Eremothecium sinecaudum TaxID=45286 RepID=A0A0X8HTL5_9SACH|nr:HEL026Wp [Eremothecium sinecaudum]AMD21254.1 HEL026Wp [Eremothecium sinecaudum]